MKMSEVIPKEDIEKARQLLLEAKRPLFLYDDDPDGLCSFLQLYRFCGKKGRGRRVIDHKVTIDHIRYIEEINADAVFILDTALLDQEFVNHAKVPIVWIDHHGPFEIKGLELYINPKKYTEKLYLPTSYLTWLIAKKDMWIAMTGTVADYAVPDFSDEFAKQYPDMFPKGVKSPEGLRYTTKIGEMIGIISQGCLKGKTSDVNKCIKHLSDMESPYELLNPETSGAKFIHKQYEKVKKEYDKLITVAVKQRKEDDILLIFTHENVKYSMAADLANELIWKNPDKIVIVARKQSGEYRCSFRSRDLQPVLGPFERAIEGLQARGGGHPRAIGAVIAVPDWKKFLERFREEMKKEIKKAS